MHVCYFAINAILLLLDYIVEYYNTITIKNTKKE